jgi:hypothetical protein
MSEMWSQSKLRSDRNQRAALAMKHCFYPSFSFCDARELESVVMVAG